MFLFRQAPILRPRELAELTEIFQIDDETDGLDNLYKLSVSVAEVLNITVHIATYLNSPDKVPEKIPCGYSEGTALVSLIFFPTFLGTPSQRDTE